ncbi:hypothetical protein GCM10017655_48840 [Pseudomonas turukhanskensis]|uniref:Uncharacterized protein n=1 Tax=Pseudomonas turukhanskensis TaxID=1806536 RepID=A0A9W6KCQ7_9PSED|nr:hypothetical protein GCM10017655_48840 [Pseudomonas turukhanskensis]
MIGPGSICRNSTFNTVPSSWKTTNQVRPRNSMEFSNPDRARDRHPGKNSGGHYKHAKQNAPTRPVRSLYAVLFALAMQG